MWYVDLGKQEYLWTLDLQYKLVAARQKGLLPDMLLLVEHPPVITLGRLADDKHILASSSLLEQEGITLHRINRGGDVTYHGPGQLVGYPIINLRSQGRDIHLYLRKLEELLIRTVNTFGLEGTRKEGYTGAWIGSRKIAAIGIAVSRWITMHGFALNVAPTLEHFSLIVPCGISDYGVTSLAEQLNGEVDMGEVKKQVIHSSEIIAMEGMEECPVEELLRQLGTAIIS